MRFQSGYSDLNATDGERKPRSYGDTFEFGKDKKRKVTLKVKQDIHFQSITLKWKMDEDGDFLEGTGWRKNG